MALNAKFLKDKNVLYVVMFVAVTNFFVYLLMHNWTAAIIFALLAYLTTYFSKNMIIVLLVAMVSTNVIVASGHMTRRVVVGMEDKKKKEGMEDKKKKEGMEDKKKKEGMKDKDEGYTNKSDINYPATLEKAYDDLDSLIGKDGIDKMTTDTAKLVEQQNKLLKNLESMTPLIQQTSQLLNILPIDSMNNIQGSLGSVINNLKGLSLNK
jgi:hypothetical protein